MINNFSEIIRAKSDQELIEMYLDSKSYQPEFVQLLTEELQQRKLPIESLDIIKSKEEQTSDKALALGQQGNPIYLVLIAISALAGGVGAIIGGYIYAYSTQVDNSGNKQFVYNESTRKWGQRILGIGVVALLFTLISKIL